MITRAIARYIRISPRKTRKVANLIKGMSAVKAGALLDTVNKRPTLYIKRLLNAALDSADKRFSLSPVDLYVSSIKVDIGPTLKRHRAASMGRATMIKHRTSHISLELEGIKRPNKVTETEKAKKSKNKDLKSKKTHVKKIARSAKARS